MKKKLMIGGGMAVLLALIWVGAKNLSATAETDVSAGEKTKQYAVDTKVKKDASNDAEETDQVKRTSPSEDSEEDNAESADGAKKQAASSGTVKARETESNQEDTASQASEASESDQAEAVSLAAEEPASEGNVLYSISTSSGSNIGMVPIVNGNAVVLMDGGSATTYQGDYSPQEQSAFGRKVEEVSSLAVSEGKIGAWAFYREPMMTDFTFPEGVSAIDKFAFARSGLQRVVIPEGVTSIGCGAFYHCDALTDVTIPGSVTTIEENAFSHTPWLKNWLAGGSGAEGEEEAQADGETAENVEVTEMSEKSDADDFLIVGDGILLAYRGNEEEPELPAEVKSVVPGVLGGQ